VPSQHKRSHKRRLLPVGYTISARYECSREGQQATRVRQGDARSGDALWHTRLPFDQFAEVVLGACGGDRSPRP
jgi:hypothetical protein